jgi:hypothetical protein
MAIIMENKIRLNSKNHKNDIKKLHTVQHISLGAIFIYSGFPNFFIQILEYYC